MRPIDLLAAIGTADERLLKQSETRSHRASITVAVTAACLCLVITALVRPFFGARLGASNDLTRDPDTQETTSDGSVTYDVCAGPVLPLTLREENESIQASRDVTYNFAGALYGRSAVITDSYVLTNRSDQDQTVSLRYPMQSSYISMMEDGAPKVLLDGQTAEYALLDGAGVEIRLHNIASLPNDGLFHAIGWEHYVALLSDGSYFAEAMGEIDRLTLDLSTPVYVYQLSGLSPTEQTDAEDLEWAVKCTGWTIGAGFHGMFDGWSLADGTRDLWFTSIGEKLTDLEYRGYSFDHGFVDITATVTIHESTLEQELKSLLSNYMGAAWPLSVEQIFPALKKDLQDLHDETGDYFYNGVGQAVGSTLSRERIFYLSLDVTIPAGESRTVAFTQTKSGSYNIDYMGDGTVADGYGYDMMTTLGSNLHLTDAHAAIQGYDGLEILYQNFGFDLPAGITAVDLDLTVPHYYLTVQRMEPDQ